MTRRPTGGWPHDWRRPAVTVAALVLLVAGYPAAPWAPNIPAPNEILGLAVGYDDYHGRYLTTFEGPQAAIPANSSKGLIRIERVAQPPDPATSVRFDPDEHQYLFRLSRDQFEDLGGVTATIDRSVISLRPITTGQYLVCDFETDRRGYIFTSCLLRSFQVPGWSEW